MTIHPAELQFREDGTPFSDRYGDVYHAREGGLEQSHYVFLAGNELPTRWQGRETFVVVETGFGLGLNFLATWGRWRADPQRSKRLHFVSFELHPFQRQHLRQLHARWTEFAPLAAQLQLQWPALTEGFHRLHFEGDDVCLTLYFGDARTGLAQLDAQADAFYLDGFSPARNPELWSERLFYLLARLARPGATLATWSVAGSVRSGLQHAGFVVEKAEGFATKRHMLRGHHPGPRYPLRHPVSRLESGQRAHHAIIVGAGLAGTAIAQRLAVRGWQLDIIDAAASPGMGASGNHAGVLRIQPSRDNNPIQRISRAGTLYGWQHIRRLNAQGFTVRAEACGVLQLARDAEQQEMMRTLVEHAGLPADVLDFVDAARASELAEWPLTLGGWWFANSGWVQPPSLCEANLAAARAHVRSHWNCQISHYAYNDDQWQVFDATGTLVAAAPYLILCAGTGVLDLVPEAYLPVVKARGQVSLLPAASGSPPPVVVCRAGYVSPAVDGWRCAGATFTVDDPETALRSADHEENLSKLDAMLPGFTTQLNTADIHGRVGFRPASPDRLPMVGAMPLLEPLDSTRPLLRIARQPGLFVASGFGARGLVWSALLAENLASQLNGDPLPLEHDLQDAIDPARYVLREARLREKRAHRAALDKSNSA